MTLLYDKAHFSKYFNNLDFYINPLTLPFLILWKAVLTTVVYIPLLDLYYTLG